MAVEYETLVQGGHSKFAEEIFNKIAPVETESGEGNPITIETDSAQIAKNTHLTFEPIQDLHGYDHPWPAGGGKNKFNGAAVATTNTNNWGVAWNDSTNTLTIEHKNTYSSGMPSVDLNLAAGTYVVSGNLSKGIDVYKDGAYMTQLISGRTFVAESGHNYSFYFPNTEINTTTYSNLQLELGSTATTFAPYSNVCPISGLDEVEVKRTGKNLLDPNTLIAGDYNGTNRPIRVSQALEDRIIIIAGEKYGLSIKSYDRTLYPCNLIWMAITDENNVLQRIIVPAANGNASAVIPQEFDGMRLTIIFGGYANDGSWAPITVSDVISMNPMLERYSDSPTYEYEPYDGQVITESLPTTVYGGTLDLETGELVADRVMRLVGECYWYGRNGVFYTDSAINKITHGDGRFDHVISDTYKTQNVGISGSLSDGEISVDASGYIQLRDMRYTVASDFKQAMNGVQLCYELATPITYTLTPQQLALLKGTNHISANAKTVKVTFRNGKFATLEDINAANSNVDAIKTQIEDLGLCVQNGLLCAKWKENVNE